VLSDTLKSGDTLACDLADGIMKMSMNDKKSHAPLVRHVTLDPATDECKGSRPSFDHHVGSLDFLSHLNGNSPVVRISHVAPTSISMECSIHAVVDTPRCVPVVGFGTSGMTSSCAVETYVLFLRNLHKCVCFSLHNLLSQPKPSHEARFRVGKLSC
jgi:hypothetical protein